MAAISATRPSIPLYHGARSSDILLVQINPVERRETPRSPAEIRDRLNEISFNANLLRELRAIDFVDDLIEDGVLGRSNAYKQVLLHRIDGSGSALDDASASSRLRAQWPFFLHLRDAGRDAAKAWLAENYDAVGRESTLNLRRCTPEPAAPAADAPDVRGPVPGSSCSNAATAPSRPRASTAERASRRAIRSRRIARRPPARSPRRRCDGRGTPAILGPVPASRSIPMRESTEADVPN